MLEIVLNRAFFLLSWSYIFFYFVSHLAQLCCGVCQILSHCISTVKCSTVNKTNEIKPSILIYLSITTIKVNWDYKYLIRTKTWSFIHTSPCFSKSTPNAFLCPPPLALRCPTPCQTMLGLLGSGTLSPLGMFSWKYLYPKQSTALYSTINSICIEEFIVVILKNLHTCILP